MNYQRVIPRDLFNESMLLKCLGALSLAIHDQSNYLLENISFEHFDEKRGFIIGQDVDGNISCGNLRLLFRGYFEVYLYHPLNSREPWPLRFKFLDYEGRVFDDYGKFSEEFLEMLQFNKET